MVSKEKATISTYRYCNSLFTADGRLRDGGIKLLKKARNRGIDPCIRADVWPFLLGVYDLNSSEVERNAVKVRKRKEYEKLRIRCLEISNYFNQANSLVTLEKICSEAWLDLTEDPYYHKTSEYGTSSRFSLSLWSGNEEDRPVYDRSPDAISNLEVTYTDSSDSDYSVDIHQNVGDPYSELTKSASLKINASNRIVEDLEHGSGLLGRWLHHRSHQKEIETCKNTKIYVVRPRCLCPWL